MTRQLIVVDTETTGLDTAQHWPLEVAAINVATGEEFYFVPVLPGDALNQADGKAMQINRYFERGVYADRLSLAGTENAWLQLWDMLAGNTLGGSNPAFDAAMLNRGVQYHGAPSPWHHRLADLAAFAAPAMHLPPNELPGLDKVCQYLEVENEGDHTALGDARATAECFKRLTAMYAGGVA